MDTSETSIKMCDCPEIERQGFEKLGEAKRYDDITRRFKFNWGKNNFFIGRTWLPRQDQIQEMMDYGLGAFVNDFHEFCEDDLGMYSDSDCKFHDYKSMEQLWLAFYMHEKHKKKWDGEKWVNK